MDRQRMRIFDTHAHYFASDFGEGRDSLLKSLNENGVELIMAVGCDLESSAEQTELAERFDFMYSAAGIHPEYAANLPADWAERLRKILSNGKVKALGEIGIDLHYDDSPALDIQRDVFVKQLELAEEFNLPVIIHSRDACLETMEILKKYKPRGVVHCFSYSAETAKEVVKLGMYVGFTGVLTFKNAKKAAAACEAVPIERLLLETDCPYMAPEPFRGKPSDSSMIEYTAAKMAEIKGVSAEEMINIANENGKRLFSID